MAIVKVISKVVRTLKKKSQKGKPGGPKKPRRGIVIAGSGGKRKPDAKITAKAKAAKVKAAKAKAAAAKTREARKKRFVEKSITPGISELREAGMLGQYGLHAKAATVATGGLAATGAASYGLPEAEAAAPYALKTIWYNAKTLAKAKADGMSPSLIARFKKQKRLHVVQPKKQGNLGMQEFTTGGFTGPTSSQYTGMPKGPQRTFTGNFFGTHITDAKLSPKKTTKASYASHHRLITHKARAPETQWTPFYGPKKGVKIDLKGKDWLMQKMWTPISGPAEAARGVAPTKRGVDKKIVKGYYVNMTDAEKGKLSTIARAEQAYKTGRYKPRKTDKPMSEARAKKLGAAGIQTQYIPYTKTQGNVSAMAKHGVVKIKMPDGTVRFFGSHEAAIKAYNKALIE